MREIQEYWKIAVDEILGDEGFVFTSTQRDAIALRFQDASEMKSEVTGEYLANQNFVYVMRNEKATLDKAAQDSEVYKAFIAKALGIRQRGFPYVEDNLVVFPDGSIAT